MSRVVALAVYTFLLYTVISAMSSEPEYVEIGGRKVKLSDILKPHNVVVGGTNKPVPNLENFPPLEPQFQHQGKDTREDTGEEK